MCPKLAARLSASQAPACLATARPRSLPAEGRMQQPMDILNRDECGTMLFPAEINPCVSEHALPDLFRALWHSPVAHAALLYLQHAYFYRIFEWRRAVPFFCWFVQVQRPVCSAPVNSDIWIQQYDHFLPKSGAGLSQAAMDETTRAKTTQVANTSSAFSLTLQVSLYGVCEICGTTRWIDWVHGLRAFILSVRAGHGGATRRMP